MSTQVNVFLAAHAYTVRGPQHVAKKGKTPVRPSEEARKLLDSIETVRIAKRKDRTEVEEPYLGGHIAPGTTRLYDRQHWRVTRNIVEWISI